MVAAVVKRLGHPDAGVVASALAALAATAAQATTWLNTCGLQIAKTVNIETKSNTMSMGIKHCLFEW